MKRFELFFAFILLPLDAAMIVLSFVLAYYFRANLDLSQDFLNIKIMEYLKYAIIILPFWITLLALNGLYQIKTPLGILRRFARIFIASSTAMLLLTVTIFFARSLFFSRLVLIFTWFSSILFLYVGRSVILSIKKLLNHYGFGLRRILIVGSNKTSGKIIELYLNNPALGYKVAGLVGPEKQSQVKLLGSLSQAEEIIKKSTVNEVLLTDISIPRKELLLIMQACYDKNILFKYVPDLYSMMTANFVPGLIGSMPVMEMRATQLDGWGRIIKRIIDVIFSLLLILFFSPFLVLIALLVKLSSPGPIFFKHDRVGRNGKIFKFYKFRSMYTEKCDWEQKGLWTTANDEKTRITPWGKILRKTNLDELPQLFSILKGDMSFVGPRPEQPKLVDKFEKEIPDYFLRHRVKVGLTSWASVNGLKGDTSIEERVKYDIYYIENWSLWFDLKILLKTVWLVFYEAIAGKYEYRSRP